MKIKRVLAWLLVIVICISLLFYTNSLKGDIPSPANKPSAKQLVEFSIKPNSLNELIQRYQQQLCQYKNDTQPLDLTEVNVLLNQPVNQLQPQTIQKIMATLACSKNTPAQYQPILTIIDYSLPSSEKRLWVFNLHEKKLLFHTHVSHGLKSGELNSNFFSNKNDSKASSIGVYRTDQSYYGREGLSLRLTGLEQGFNDNASNRYIVMHGAWYLDEQFIKKYGRAGRSWGCPALPETLSKDIINTIKDNSVLVIYYPSEQWFAKSKYLNCQAPVIHNNSNQASTAVEKSTLPPTDQREAIFYADLNNNNQREESDPILVIKADHYMHVFQKKAPLTRMLRRQINHEEYIALTTNELQHLLEKPNNLEQTPTQLQGITHQLNQLYFVIPVIKMQRGYYATEMHFLSLGTINDIKVNENVTKTSNGETTTSFTVYFEKNPAKHLKPTQKFIRWLGL